MIQNLGPWFFSMPDPIPGIQTALDPGSGSTTLVSFRVFHCIKRWLDYILCAGCGAGGGAGEATNRGRVEENRGRSGEDGGGEAQREVVLSDIYYIFYILFYLFLARNLQTFTTFRPCAITLLCKFCSNSGVNYFCCFLILFAEAKGRFCPCQCETF